MGASLACYIHKNNPTPKQLHNGFYSQQSDSTETGYSGTLAEKDGLEIQESTVYKDEEAARDALESNGKYDYAWALPFKGDVKIPNAKKKKAIEAKEKAEKAFDDACEKTVLAIRSTKSKTISCRHCKARMNRDTIKTIACPSCNRNSGSILSATQEKAISNKREKCTQANTKVEQMRNETKTVKGINYLVGGFCAE